MKKRLLVLPMALLMVVMGASPALALGVRDLCVSQGGQTVYQTGDRTCFSDPTSQAVAFNQSFADASNASQAVAIDGFAGANEHSQVVAIESFAVAQSYSQAVAIDRSFALASNSCAVAALNGEAVSC
jgi:hypothetical protein